MIVIEERIICRMLEGLFQFGKECEWNDAIEEAMHRFVNLPAIDAVEVVRCKECKWRHDDSNTQYLPCTDWYPPDDFYCAYGERRTDETN